LSRILVTGGTGFVGSRLLPGLVARSHTVISVVRAARPSISAGVQVEQIGEIGSQTHWERVLREVDVVVHLAARAHVTGDNDAASATEYHEINVEGTKHLARAAVKAGVQRLIFLSSIGVHGDKTGAAPFNEESPFFPQTRYAQSKLAAEQVLALAAKESSLETVVLRPPLVYGPGNPGNFARFLRLVTSGFPLPFAGIRNRRSLIYIGNLVDALIACVEHPAAAGRAFVIRDGHDISTPDLVAKLARCLCRPVRLLPCPVPVLMLGGRMLGRSRDVERLVSDLVIDDAAIRRDLDWVPRYALDEGLAATAEWWRTREV
jgi:nucleoside-diphosphate-sugar epimerase